MTLGVVIVTYNACGVIRDCLETLLASKTGMRVVVVDNASTDTTVQVIRDWANGTDAYTPPVGLPFATRAVVKPTDAVTLIQSGRNGGFAAGVNIGMSHLLASPAVNRVWILNPDTLVPPGTPAAIASAPDGFSLMGGRVVYADPPHLVQIDAGTINKWTGVTGNLNLGAPMTAPPPAIENADFISGASLVASRTFIEQVGPMPENYFLYYEEVDWATKRKDLPLSFCADAMVYHRAGTAIGSPTLTSPASPFSVYYKHRARMMYLRRHHPRAILTGYAYGLAKALQHALKGQLSQAGAIVRAIHGRAMSSDKAAQPRNQPIKRRG